MRRPLAMVEPDRRVAPAGVKGVDGAANARLAARSAVPLVSGRGRGRREWPGSGRACSAQAAWSRPGAATAGAAARLARVAGATGFGLEPERPRPREATPAVGLRSAGVWPVRPRAPGLARKPRRRPPAPRGSPPSVILRRRNRTRPFRSLSNLFHEFAARSGNVNRAVELSRSRSRSCQVAPVLRGARRFDATCLFSKIARITGMLRLRPDAHAALASPPAASSARPYSFIFR